MASPPYRSPATSPPHPPNTSLPNPKKRPSVNVPTYAPSLKRQKRGSFHSAASSAHPLRQTSFPPEESAIITGERSPSVDSEITNITGKGSLAKGVGKKRRSRGKGKQTAASVNSGAKEKTLDGREGTGEVPDDDEEEEDDEGGDELVGNIEEEDREAEEKKLAVLIGAFNEDQEQRYQFLRRFRLKKETVRKITNQTVSQSVPPNVITTVNGYTKTFIGTLIERAREVQEQYASLETPPSTPPKVPIDPTDFSSENPNNEIFQATSPMDALGQLSQAAANNEHQATPKQKSRDLGPLLPDHFREALRRHKRDGEGGTTGLQGVSTGLGLPGNGSAKLGGRRLFR
ncbi:hTAFII28-like protein conserved region-domain-containing protein [Usnea florida]